MTENAFYVPVGNGTETSMIKWLQDADFPVHKIMLETSGRIKATIPFDTKYKNSIVAVAHPQMEDTVRVYVKGAPENIVENCNAFFDERGDKSAFGNETKDYVLANIMRDAMTKQGFRVIAFSYKDYSVDDFNNFAPDSFHDENVRKELESDQTFIGMVAMKDPLRNRVKQVTEYARKGGINIRLISGDNLDTAKAAAVDAGILTAEEFNSDAPLDEQRKYCMDASDFREKVGALETD